MEIGKVFIHTKRNIAYTTRWPLALRERHEIKRSRRESKHTQAHKTHTHTDRGTVREARQLAVVLLCVCPLIN